jgi:hypothetical protein
MRGPYVLGHSAMFPFASSHRSRPTDPPFVGHIILTILGKDKEKY